ncbi:MAG: hypothetical protein U5K54_13155 [Cytophagales bacterium]|nr:hypothetical protein [Cytophagales bacterium]
MSEVIQEESVVVRVGCLAGPNLAKELAQRQPGATVVASHFHEVIQLGKKDFYVMIAFRFMKIMTLLVLK